MPADQRGKRISGGRYWKALTGIHKVDGDLVDSRFRAVPVQTTHYINMSIFQISRPHSPLVRLAPLAHHTKEGSGDREVGK